MNRFKREMRKKGVKLASDYPMLPFYIKGKSCFEQGYIFVDDVVTESETASVYVVTNVAVKRITMLRNGNVINKM